MIYFNHWCHILKSYANVIINCQTGCTISPEAYASRDTTFHNIGS